MLTDTETTPKIRHGYDVFISHASEDKNAFIRPLASELTRLGLVVWYDEATLRLGDSLRMKIDEGLASSTYGVVVLSPSFFVKGWPKAELDALFAREMTGQKVILPVWHRLSAQEVLQHSPLLSGRLAISSDRGVEVVAREIFSIVRPNVAPPVREPQNRAMPASGDIGPLTELLRTINDVAPLLHKLDVVVAAGRDAQTFLQALQRFFYGSNILTQATDENLRYGADNLLRVLSTEGLHPDYMRGKLATAGACFEEFRSRTKLGHPFPEVGSERIPHEIQFLHTSLLTMMEDAGPLPPEDRLPLRLIAALLDYGSRQHPENPKQRFPQIPQGVHYALRDYLAEAFQTQLRVALPDALDSIWGGDMRAYCHSAWREIQREDQASVGLVFGALWDTLWPRFRWRSRVKTVTAEELLNDIVRP